MNRECEWEGTVGTLEAHVATCEFTLVPCPNGCMDDSFNTEHLLKKDLDNHMENDCPNRVYKCDHVYCGEEGTYAYITLIHDEQCQWKPIPCPNADCTDTMRRFQMEAHLDTCDYSEIPCKYQKLGCGMKIRKDMPAHEKNDQLHINMALDKVADIEMKITAIEEDIAAMKKKSDTNILRRGEITFKLSAYQEKKDNNIITHFSTFYSSRNGYHMQMEVVANGDKDGKDTHVSVYIQMLEGKYDAELNWPFVGKITIELLNQQFDYNHHEETGNLTKEKMMVVGKRRGYSKFIPHSELAGDRLGYTQYLKNDTLYFRVSVDIPDHKPWLQCTAK